MLNPIQKLLAPPVFENDEEKTRTASYLNMVILVILLPAIITLPITVIYGAQLVGSQELAIGNLIITLISILVFTGLRILLMRGVVYPVAWTIVITNWASITYLLYLRSSIADLATLLFVLSTLFAALIISPTAGFVSFGVTSLIMLTLGLMERDNLLPPRPSVNPLDQWLYYFIVSGIIVTFSSLVKKNLTDAVRKARENELVQIQTNEALMSIQASLEQRVAKRTREINLVNQRNERRIKQFEAITQIAHDISSIQDLDSLLPDIARVISRQFNYYHVGIFLLDANREYAVLRAANSEGGQKMLAREHKLKIGQTGIVGFVTATGKPRVALDVGDDAVYFDNLELPDTHSEMALPLRVAGQIIGALDVQSTESNAFTQDDVDALSTLADQVSSAIQNARTFQETRELLKEAQEVISTRIHESWKIMQPASLGKGYQMAGSQIMPLETRLEGEHVQQAVETNKTVIMRENDFVSHLAVPIRMRGKTIGVMNLQLHAVRDWSPDEVDIVEAVAERISLAIEAASLMQATQRRADIERVTASISDKISSSTRFETILQTAAQELSRALGGSEVLVQIEPLAVELGMDSIR